MKMAEISILVPVYNAKQYLQQCLESIRNQHFTDYEVLMIDDGSRDGSSEICDKFVSLDDRFQVRHQHNQGSGCARNCAIDWATETDSKYVVWVDADDIVHPLYLECLYQTIQEHPECDIVQCRYGTSEDALESYTGGKANVSNRFNNSELLTEMLGGSYGIDFAVLWNKLYCKNLFQNVRVRVSEYFSGRMQDDVNILSQIYKKSHGCCLIEEELYFYRIVQNSIQHKKISNVNLEYLYIYRDLYFECKGTEFDSFADYLGERILFDIARKLGARKDQYVDYKDFYKNLKKLYKALSNQINFVCSRPDLCLLNASAKRCFYAFRLYAVLYNYSRKVKSLPDK